MRNLIPHYIHDQVKAEHTHGSVNAVAMFVDISGFTSITEELMKVGKEGAEILANLVNDRFQPLIDLVYLHHGFITHFAGDSFTALFIDGDTLYEPCVLAQTVLDTINEIGNHKTRVGLFNITAKIGLSLGTVEWRIVCAEEQKTYYFEGNALNECAQAQQFAGDMEIVIHESYLNQLDVMNFELEPLQGPFFKVVSLHYTDAILPSNNVSNMSNEIIHQFTHNQLDSYPDPGEFRYIINVFIKIQHSHFTKQEMKLFVQKALLMTNQFDGYFRGIQFDDKGATLLVIFGAPIAHDNDMERAQQLSLYLRDTFSSQIRMGIAAGISYFGLIGSFVRSTYDTLGNAVNLSARIAMHSKWGEIWLSEEVANAVQKSFRIERLPAISIKGFISKQILYKLIDNDTQSLYTSDKWYHGKMIGRESEVAYLIECIHPILNHKLGGIIYIYGDAGIGKSRFVYEVLQSFGTRIQSHILQTDRILNKSLSPFLTFLALYFHQMDAPSSQERESNYSNQLSSLYKQLEHTKHVESPELMLEIQRTHSCFRALLGLSTKGMLFDQLDPKGRWENTVSGIKALVKGLSIIKPLVLVIEDIHCIDRDSSKLIHDLTRNVDTYPFALVATSRYLDSDSKATFHVDPHVPIHEVNLEKLSSSSADAIIKHWLGQPTEESVLTYIHSKTKGNPFYIEQYCLYLVEHFHMKSYPNHIDSTILNEEMPSSITSILTARIDRLSNRLKETFQIASVLGTEFNSRVLFKIIQTIQTLLTKDTSYTRCKFAIDALKQTELHSLLSQGKTNGLWVNSSEILYLFVQVLLRDTAYNMQIGQRLQVIHQAAGESLEALYGSYEENYANMAHHFEHAENFEKAIHYYIKLGNWLKATYKNERALETYAYVYELIQRVYQREEENLPDPLSFDFLVMDILFNQAEIYELLGDWNHAISNWEACVNLSQHYDNEGYTVEQNSEHKSVNQVKSQCRLALIYGTTGEINKGLALLNQILETAQSIKDQRYYSQLLNNFGVLYRLQGETQLSIEYHKKSLAIREYLSDKEGIAESYKHIGTIHYTYGDYDQALDHFYHALKMCKEMNDKRGIASLYNNIGIVYSTLYQYELSIQNHKKSLEIKIEIGDKKGISSSYNNLGNAFLILPDYQQALEYYTKSKAIKDELGDELSKGYSNISIGNVYLQIGYYDIAEQAYRKAFTTMQERGGKQEMASILNNIGNIYVAKGDYSKALEVYQESLEMHQAAKAKLGIIHSLNNMGIVHYSQANYLASMQYFDQSKELAEPLGDEESIAIAYRYIARIHSEKNNMGLAEQHLEKSKAIYEKLNSRMGMAGVCFDYGFIYFLHNQHEKSIEYYTQSLDMYKKCGALWGISGCYSQLACNNAMLHQFQPTFTMCQHGIKLAEELALDIEKAWVYLAIAMLFNMPDAKKAPEKSLLNTIIPDSSNQVQSLFDSALKIATNINNALLKIKLYVEKGKFLYHSGYENEGAAAIQEAMQMAKDHAILAEIHNIESICTQLGQSY